MTAALDAIRDALATALFMRYGSVERGWYRVRHEWVEDADVILGTLPLDAIRARLTSDLGAALETWANETGEDGYPDPDFLVAEMPDFIAAFDRAEATPVGHALNLLSVAEQRLHRAEAVVAAARAVVDPPDSNGFNVRPGLDHDSRNILIPMSDPMGFRLPYWSDLRAALRAYEDADKEGVKP